MARRRKTPGFATTDYEYPQAPDYVIAELRYDSRVRGLRARPPWRTRRGGAGGAHAPRDARRVRRQARRAALRPPGARARRARNRAPRARAADGGLRAKRFRADRAAQPEGRAADRGAAGARRNRSGRPTSRRAPSRPPRPRAPAPRAGTSSRRRATCTRRRTALAPWRVWPIAGGGITRCTQLAANCSPRPISAARVRPAQTYRLPSRHAIPSR